MTGKVLAIINRLVGKASEPISWSSSSMPEHRLAASIRSNSVTASLRVNRSIILQFTLSCPNGQVIFHKH